MVLLRSRQLISDHETTSELWLKKMKGTKLRQSNISLRIMKRPQPEEFQRRKCSRRITDRSSSMNLLRRSKEVIKQHKMLALPKDNTMLAPPKDNKMLNRSRVTSCHFEEPEEPCNTLSEWKTLKTLKR